MLERRKKLKKIMSLQEKELKKMEEKLKKKAKKVKKQRKQIKKMYGGSEDRSPLLYLVVRHAAKFPAYSLDKTKPTLKTADSHHRLPVPRCIAYLDAEHDMGFTAMRSERRSWIVGVGGFPDLGEDREQTIVFDCKTGVVAKGPRPRALKVEPVLFCVGEKIYALTSRPSARVPDRPPWFEVLDLSGASCVNGRLRDCSWRPLSPPPLFPILDEKAWFQISGGSSVQVESYAVVSHYILLSIVRDPFTLEDQCTLAFDTLAEEWYYVDKQKNLPFIGEAIPYSRLFLGRSRDKQLNDLTAYIISVTKTSTSSPILSILEVPCWGFRLPVNCPTARCCSMHAYHLICGWLRWPMMHINSTMFMRSGYAIMPSDEGHVK
ncbi:hypothetical protein QOZ80_6BG0494250 [Eleusine coracana subsp. coracana]|nr:hypothetical protein QOZ80_6BG0494250 [Eleusine coracana subsp. coracana]